MPKAKTQLNLTLPHDLILKMKIDAINSGLTVSAYAENILNAYYDEKVPL